MSLHLLDFRPLATIPRRDKAKLPVSIALGPDGSQVIVSRYGDSVWDFYPYIDLPNAHANQKVVKWRIALPDGRLLTDPEHSALLESAKDFLWSLVADPVEGRKRATMQTLIRKAVDLATLLRWMVGLGINRFSDLEGRTLDYVDVARYNIKGQPASGEAIAHRLLLVEDIYHQRDKLSDALSIHPWPHETTTSLSGRSMNTKPRTEFIPDAVASKIGELAIDYIQNRAENIICAFESADAAAQRKAVAGMKTTAQAAARAAIATEAGFEGWTALVREMSLLRTACYIVIAMFSGIRDSEMKSLENDCLASGKSKDGTTDVLWLHGTIYKTGKRPKRWMVPPIVETAVRVLARCTEPLRDAMEAEKVELKEQVRIAVGRERARLVKRLDYVCKHKGSLFLARPMKKKDRGITVLTGNLLGIDLKNFCADLGVHGSGGKPYLLHSHQFRRTYARFMARSELGDLLTLRDHFGHWSIDMTTYYADGGANEYEADTELLEMVASEKQSRQSEIMGRYLDSDAPLANGGHWLKDWRRSVRTAANKEALINEFAGSITLNGTGHSWCVGNAKGTGCGGLCIFEAKMCVDCNYGIIGQEHRPVWEGIREQQLDALSLKDMGPGGEARAKEILGYAEKVLTRLDGQEKK